MNRYLEHSWLRMTLLLGALTAGALLTRIVPTYEEMAALRDRPTPPAASEVRTNQPSDMTGIDVDQRHLKFVQSIA
jgi:hypothetical protein